MRRADNNSGEYKMLSPVGGAQRRLDLHTLRSTAVFQMQQGPPLLLVTS